MAPSIGKVLSVNVGKAREFDYHGRPAKSAIWKSPVAGRVPNNGESRLALGTVFRARLVDLERCRLRNAWRQLCKLGGGEIRQSQIILGHSLKRESQHEYRRDVESYFCSHAVLSKQIRCGETQAHPRRF